MGVHSILGVSVDRGCFSGGERSGNTLEQSLYLSLIREVVVACVTRVGTVEDIEAVEKFLEALSVHLVHDLGPDLPCFFVNGSVREFVPGRESTIVKSLNHIRLK